MSELLIHLLLTFAKYQFSRTVVAIQAVSVYFNVHHVHVLSISET